MKVRMPATSESACGPSEAPESNAAAALGVGPSAQYEKVGTREQQMKDRDARLSSGIQVHQRT
jgi:hypothetical protein